MSRMDLKKWGVKIIFFADVTGRDREDCYVLIGFLPSLLVVDSSTPKAIGCRMAESFPSGSCFDIPYPIPFFRGGIHQIIAPFKKKLTRFVLRISF
jgi:hypothetical protein